MKVLIDSATRRVKAAWNDGDEPQTRVDGHELVTVAGDVRTFVWPHRGTTGHSKLSLDGTIIFESPQERKIDVLIAILDSRLATKFTDAERARLDAAK